MRVVCSAQACARLPAAASRRMVAPPPYRPHRKTCEVCPPSAAVVPAHLPRLLAKRSAPLMRKDVRRHYAFRRLSAPFAGCHQMTFLFRSSSARHFHAACPPMPICRCAPASVAFTRRAGKMPMMRRKQQRAYACPAAEAQTPTC